MSVVIDTNILLSALIKDSVTRKIIIKYGLNFYYPEISFHEIQKYKNLVLKKSGMNEKEYKILLDCLFDHIILIPEKQIIQEIKKADKIIGNIDIDDVVFLACAIALNADIWSDDKDFKKQRKVDVFTTQEFMKRFLKKG